ncbi:MAG: hypothetical protein AB7H43_11115 [Acidimicrobiia bacterium]
MAESLLAENRVYLADARGDGSFVRVTWHARDRQFVVSQWRDDVCVAATRVPVGAAPDLIAVLARGLGEAAGAVPEGGGAGDPTPPSVWSRTRARLADAGRRRLRAGVTAPSEGRRPRLVGERRPGQAR